jgi:hypothetical protein
VRAGSTVLWPVSGTPEHVRQHFAFNYLHSVATVLTNALAFLNSVLYLHSAFMFLYDLKLTAAVCLHISSFVYVMETLCVYCAVRT